MLKTQKTNKNILIQIGRTFYSLKKEFRIKDFKELKAIIKNPNYDLRLLKEENA